ncbi:mucin-binding protein, partial [Secundilactobacillus folii]|uniref:mucin-binding protein n=1 Tax=Secundilactobacillus folii TaxID=2678357 RepID=UPI003CCD3D2E
TPVNPDNPNGPKLGDYQSETHHTVTETITYTMPDGSQAANKYTKSLNFTRTITVDSVSGDVLTRGDWTGTDGSSFAAVTSPTVTGYTPSESAEAAHTVSGDDKGIQVTVTYTAAEHDFTVTPKTSNGSPVPDTTPTTEKGTTGEPITKTNVPDVLGYTPTFNNEKVPDGDSSVDIVYTPDAQKGTVHFVDKAGETLAPDIDVTGVTNGAVDRTAVRNQIQQIINQQYNLVSDGTGIVFNNVDDDNQDFEVVFA